MYFLCGAAANVQTLIVLASPHLPPGQPLTEQSVAAAYRDYLALLQPDVPTTGADATALIREEGQAALLASLFGLPGASESVADAGRGKAPSMDDRKAAFFEKGLIHLAHYVPELSAIFQTAVTSLFSTRNSNEPGSMTTRAALGAVWVSPLDSWSIEDLTEAYVHEFTHTLVMLDEHRYGHYPHHEELDRAENLVSSAIRKEKRSLFVSAHSILVASELLQLREAHHGHEREFRIHPPSREMREKAMSALESALALPNIDRLISPRLRELLESAGKEMSALRLTPSGH